MASIYETNVDNQTDRIQLTRYIPLILDWLQYHPSEAFDIERAKAEFGKHAAQYFSQQQKRKTEQQREKAIHAQALERFCQELGETAFEVVLSDKNGEYQTRLGWNDKLRDPETHETIGKIRELCPVGWVRPSFDPRDPKQRGEYLREIHRLFEGQSYHSTHYRRVRDSDSDPDRIMSMVEKAPFKRRPAPTYTFTLTLRWKSTPS
jgi:hypothetical protein